VVVGLSILTNHGGGAGGLHLAEATILVEIKLSHGSDGETLNTSRRERGWGEQVGKNLQRGRLTNAAAMHRLGPAGVS
jgi:hypothetical protein